MSRRGGRSLAWYLLVGGGLIAVGLTLVPGLTGTIPVWAAVELAGNDYFLLGAFGAVTLVALGWTVWRRATSHLDVAEPPDPETVPTGPRPGHAFDAAVARSASLRPWCQASERERVRERLREAALAAEMRREGIPRDAARARLEAGDWSSDPRVARLLRPGASFRLTVGERVRAVLRGRTSFQRAAAAAADEITRRDGGADGHADDRPADRPSPQATGTTEATGTARGTESGRGPPPAGEFDPARETEPAGEAGPDREAEPDGTTDRVPEEPQ